MANRKDNLKNLFSNTRTRVIIIFTLIILLTIIGIGYFKLRHVNTAVLSSNVVNTPNIQSIPGALNPTTQYAKLQEQQNLDQAQQAQQTGGSAIPTIIRTQAIGSGVGVIGAQDGVGFSTLARENDAGAQRSLWVQNLQQNHCSKTIIKQIVSQGAQLSDLKSGCDCAQLKDVGYTLKDLQTICKCKELKAAGFSARELKDNGFSARRLRLCGFNACELRAAGFTAKELKDAGFTDGELKGAGFSDKDIALANGQPAGITSDDIRKAGCETAALVKLRKAGVSAAAIRRISGCSAAQLKAAGFTAQELKDAGFTAAELKAAGFSAADLQAAGFPDNEIKGTTGQGQSYAPTYTCDVASLKKAREDGVTAATLRKTLGCSAAALKEAGFTAKELKDAGFTAAELKAAGFSAQDLKNAGFSAKELSDAGFTPDQLKAAGFTAEELREAGVTPAHLRKAGYSTMELKRAGFNADEIAKGGFNAAEMQDAGMKMPDSSVVDLDNPKQPKSSSSIIGIPKLPAVPLKPSATSIAQANNEHLQAILQKQQEQIAEQKYQQKIQQRTSDMLGAANGVLQFWKQVSTQVYTSGSEEKQDAAPGEGTGSSKATDGSTITPIETDTKHQPMLIKTGDIYFAVLDTSINSDEPGPILATIVSGRFKGAKLIGSFTLPANADNLVISFNTMSVPGAAKTTSIAAYAIDPNTARTALSSRTNHHYLLRYGSVFASLFMEGFGNAFQSANTTVTVGGTGGGNNITVQNGVGRSALQNAVIGLAQVGKNWGQSAQQVFNTPNTVEVYSGTGIGVLFTQDLKTL